MIGLLLSAFLACSDKEENTAPDLVNGNNTDSCGGEAPVISAITCENTGLVEHPDYGELPTFTLRASVDDVDGDLNYYVMYVEYDEVLDGVLDSDFSEDLPPSDGAVDGESCEVESANIGISIYLRGSTPEPATTYEWYISIADALGKVSDPFMVVCTTPDVDGTGDPQ